MRDAVDAGHAGGNVDPGAIGVVGIPESVIALQMAEKLTGKLQVIGHETMLTRTYEGDAASDSLLYRAELANQWPADVFISLHCNSFSGPSARGFEIWTGPGQNDSDLLATAIFEEVQAALPMLPMRADYGDGDPDKEERFTVLTATNMPAVLIEFGFISNAEDAIMLSDPAYQDIWLDAVVRGIMRWRA